MIAKAYLRLATVLVSSAVLVMAGGGLCRSCYDQDWRSATPNGSAFTGRNKAEAGLRALG
jgi:hypothetical protein